MVRLLNRKRTIFFGHPHGNAANPRYTSPPFIFLPALSIPPKLRVIPPGIRGYLVYINLD
jgi:hypothetical protein